MDIDARIAEIQRGWTAPAELARALPRPVRLSRGGVVLAVFSVVMFIGAIVTASVVDATARRQAEEKRLLRDQGANATAVVVRVWRTSGKSSRDMVRYEFEYGGSIYRRETTAPHRIWRTLSPGSRLPIRLVPLNPRINHPAEWDAQVTPRFVPWLIFGTLSAVGVFFLSLIRRQWRLLSEGRPAPGVVTRVARTKDGKVVYYKFPVLSGKLRKGSSGMRKPPAPGDALTVIYDPERPRRNAPYPLRLVRLNAG